MPFSQTDAAHTYAFTGAWNPVGAVYGIMNSKKQMIYIGQTDNLKRRMAEHQADKNHKMHRYGPALVWAEVIAQEGARLTREARLIAEYDPPVNR